MKIAIAQLNPTVGDTKGNLARLKQALDTLEPGAADLLIAPELVLAGYPPKDLLNHEWFIDRLQQAHDTICDWTRQRDDLAILIGSVRRDRKRLFNSALLFDHGELSGYADKRLLPTYDVFDEHRYFDEGEGCDILDCRGVKLGVSVCEDAWNDPDYEKTHRFDLNPIAELAGCGAEVLINLSASPFHRGKALDRFNRFAHHAKKWERPFVFAGQVGANDDLIFDGQSMVFDDEGRLIHELKRFEEDVAVVDVFAEGVQAMPHLEGNDIKDVHRALVLGVRDYLRKTGFSKAVLGLSGGIDSAVTACIAVDALGPENVRGVTMPSHYSSSGSVDDSLALADNLGIRCDTIAIKDIFNAFMKDLHEPFKGLEPDVTEENLQARIRGTLLMAYSNKFGSMLLSTGNKSELAVGYCTLYGDMNGGLAVISDLPKTMVYELAHWYNRDRALIPYATITKPPSAELAPDQVDQDTLPDYDILDAILNLYLEEQASTETIVAEGFDPETVRWVIRIVNRNEFKRKQAAQGLRVTTKAFGPGRRMPLAAKWEV